MAFEIRKIWNPANHIIIAFGIPVTGFSTGNYLTLTPDEDLIKSATGAAGEYSAVLQNNRNYTAKIRLSVSNPTTLLLGIAFELFKTTQTYLPFSSVNPDEPQLSSTSVNSHPLRSPDENFDLNPENMYRDWTIRCINLIKATG